MRMCLFLWFPDRRAGCFLHRTHVKQHVVCTCARACVCVFSGKCIVTFWAKDEGNCAVRLGRCDAHLWGISLFGCFLLHRCCGGVTV